MQNTLHINYYGFATPYGGYGIANINFMKHLRRLGVDVNAHKKYAPKPGSMEWNILTEEERDLFVKPYEKLALGIVGSTPFEFDVNESLVRIASTMCETDSVGEEWKQELQKMDYIIVPNTFCKKVFLNAGVTKPITIIPHGVDTARFYYVDRPKRKEFIFGIVGYLDIVDRKGVFDLIQAFVSEFDKSEPVRLVLHSSNPAFGYFSRFTDPRITTLTKPLKSESLMALYASLDCFVFPSKAEGVGYPPREAMATGLPTIVTNWSGLEDIALPEISYPLQPEKFETRPDFIHQRGKWARIDVQELMYWMRYVYENQLEAKEKGRKARAYLQEKYAWPKVAKQLKEFLEGIQI